ncbi:MAG: ATP-binding cassette domain-containing protein [Microbacterium sp.]
MRTGTLHLSGITKSYGDRRALDDVSFEVTPGRLTGFVGGNGAGKTTTMRIVLGLLSSDSGTVTIGNAPLTADDRRHFGYVPEERGLYPKTKILEQIMYLSRLHGFGKADATALLTDLGLEPRLNDTIESLSLGNQKRAQISASLVHDPEVLILDEPISGLEPLTVDVVAGLLQAGDAGWLRAEPGISAIDFEGGYALFEAESAEAAQRVLRAAVERGDVTSFAPAHPSLAQILKEVIQ